MTKRHIRHRSHSAGAECGKHCSGAMDGKGVLGSVLHGGQFSSVLYGFSWGKADWDLRHAVPRAPPPPAPRCICVFRCVHVADQMRDSAFWKAKGVSNC